MTQQVFLKFGIWLVLAGVYTMNHYFRKHFHYIQRAIFVTFFSALPIFSASALDFDQDGYDDFVLVEINQDQSLDWYATDLNDSQRRYIGKFGKVGDHLAVGNWSGNNVPSKAFIKKNSNGQLEWDVDGVKAIKHGSSPAKVVSGLDYDNNLSIDPTVVTTDSKNLNWSILSNPAIDSTASAREVSFGGKNTLPFFANPDGKGDQLAIASVDKKHVLTVRFRNINTNKVKTNKIGNFKSNPVSVLPAKLPNGKDVIFIVEKQGKKFAVTVINGKKKIKTITLKGDEAVVGKYLGGQTEVLAVRTGPTRATIIYPNGNKRNIAINLGGILVDDININSFSSTPSAPVAEEPSTPSRGGSNPTCIGTADSRQHLLYKPVSDTMGTVVLVFDSTYKKEFRAVKIELKDGTFAEGWWKTLVLWGNPDAGGMRQHWRTNVRAADVKDNALIIVDDTNQECRFRIPGSSRTRWE